LAPTAAAHSVATNAGNTNPVTSVPTAGFAAKECSLALAATHQPQFQKNLDPTLGSALLVSVVVCMITLSLAIESAIKKTHRVATVGCRF